MSLSLSNKGDTPSARVGDYGGGHGGNELHGGYNSTLMAAMLVEL